MRGISQEAMAHALGLNDAKAVSRLENGDSPWTLELLEGIAREVDAGSVSRLLTQPDQVHIAHANQANPFCSNISYHEAGTKERELYEARIKELVERIKQLEGENGMADKERELYEARIKELGERIKHMEGEVEFMRKTTKALPARLGEK